MGGWDSTLVRDPDNNCTCVRTRQKVLRSPLLPAPPAQILVMQPKQQALFTQAKSRKTHKTTSSHTAASARHKNPAPPSFTYIHVFGAVFFPSVSFLPWTLRMPFLSFPHLPSVLCGAHCPPLRASSGPEVAGG